MNINFRILTSEEEITAILPEWKALHASSGSQFFSQPELYEAWWKHIGQAHGWQPHLVAAWQEDRLVALAPLAVERRRGLRVLQWAGAEVFDYMEAVVESELLGELLWRYIRQSGKYDIAIIKDVREDMPCSQGLHNNAKLYRVGFAYYSTLPWKNEEEWLGSLSSAQRKDRKRKQKLLRDHCFDQVGLRSAANEPERRRTAMNMLFEQKHEWCKERGQNGMFMVPEMKDFLIELAEISAAQDALYLTEYHCGDAVMATHLGFMHHHTLHNYLATYDKKWAFCSPGIMSTYANVLHCMHLQEVKEYDLLRGGEAYKKGFTNCERRLNDYVFSKSIAGHVVKWLYLLRYKLKKNSSPVVG